MIATWKIVTNDKGRKILVVNGILSDEQKKKLRLEDYEAIYVESFFKQMFQNYHSVFSIHPLMEKSAGLKPIFVTDKLRTKLGILAEVIDGYADSPTSPGVTNKIEKIYQNIQEMGIVHQTVLIDTKESALIHSFRFVIARKQFKMTPLLSVGSTSGYVTPFIEILERAGIIDITLRKLFQLKLIELGYIRQTRFLNKVYLCPKCQHSHILFVEVCPNCKTSDIQSQAVIHHFRCANVSPETTYMTDGMLKCPKCGKYLRHIGVDYDRPTDIYICNSCTHHFTTPDMKAICTRCKETFSTVQLVPYDIYEFEFTSKGVHAFASNEAYLTLQKDIEVGISSYENFADSLRMLAGISHSDEDYFVLGRLWMMGKNGMVLSVPPDHIILQYVYMRFKNFKVATDGRMIYIAQVVSADDEKLQNAFVHEQFAKLQSEIMTLKLEYVNIQYEIFSVLKSDFDERFVKDFQIVAPAIDID